MLAQIIVAHPRQAGIFRGHLGAWVYADDKQDEFDRVELVLGKETALVHPSKFQAEAARLLPRFIPWADEQIPLDDAYEWLLTPCHRNPYAGNLFLHLVWLQLVAKHAEDGPIVVFTEASGLAMTLRQLCRDKGWKFTWHGRPRFFLRYWQSILRACSKLSYDVLRAATGYVAARIFLGAKQIGRLRDIELLIDAYVYPDSWTQDGSFSDRHLPGLLEWCREKGVRAAIYPFPVHFSLYQLPGLFKRMQADKVPMLPFESLIRLIDIPRAAALCLGYARRRTVCSRFDGIDATLLVAGDRFKASTAGLLPLLLLMAPGRMGGNGIRPRCLFDWFENQPIDRANALGFSRIGCRVVALRPYVLYPMFASLYTSERQAQAGACPSQARVCGQAMESQLRRYDGKTHYRSAPALRYGHLFSPRRSQVEGSALLVLLTHSREESLGILACLLPVLRAKPDLFSKVIVKPHGDFAGECLHRELAERWPWTAAAVWLRWELRPVDQLVQEARLTVSAGTSAALEAVCRGVPVILIGRRAGLEMNPLAEVDRRFWTTVYDAGELEQVILDWTPVHPLALAERIALGKAIRADYFEPVNEHTMQAYSP